VNLKFYFAATNGESNCMEAVAEMAALPSFRTRDNHHISIWVANPHFLLPGIRIDVRLFDDLCLQRTRTLNGPIKIAHFKPK